MVRKRRNGMGRAVRLLDRLTYRTSARISVIFLATALVVGVTVLGMIRSVLPEHPRNQLSERLGVLILNTSASAPKFAALGREAEAMDMSLMVVEGDRVWRSSDRIPPPAAFGPFAAPDETDADGRIGRRFSLDGHSYFLLRDGGRLLILGDYHTGLSSSAQINLVLGAVTIPLACLICYLAIARVVAPVAPLSNAVMRIGDGDLAYRVPVMARDELGDLSLRINDMAAALERAESSKRDMLIALGHEFSSPIARVLFQIERIEDPTLRRSIADNLMRVNLLFRSLISVETLRSLDAQRPDAPALIFPDTIARIAGNAGDGHVRLVLPAARRRLQIDPMVIEILLNNFISNARRHAPQSEIEVSASHDGAELHLAVADRGPGMPEDFLAVAQEPFSRVDSARRFDTGGLGLGLYLCGRIIRQAGGRLALSNRRGGGLLVEVWLPCAVAPPAVAGPGHSASLAERPAPQG